MAVSGINGGSAGSTIESSTGAFGKLKSDEFIKVMLSELKNQDPLNPQDSSKLLEQLSSLRNIESQLDLQDKLSSLVLQNQVASAGNMIGKLVSGLDDSNDAIQGVVTAVRVADGKAILELDSGKTLGMDRVTRVGPKQTATAPAAA